MPPDPAAAYKYRTAANQQQQDSRSQLEDQTQLVTSSGTPAALSSSGQALSTDRSVSSSFCALDSSSNRAVSQLATSGPHQQQQQQQLAVLSAPASQHLQQQHEATPSAATAAAAAAAAAAASIAPADDPLWLLRHLMSQDPTQQHVPCGAGGRAGVTWGPARLGKVQAAAASM
jgi:hypothetical protein